MTDLAEIDSYYKALKLSGRRGRPAWRATDELTRPDEAAVRRAAFYIEILKRTDKGFRNGRHDRVIEQTFEYMRKKAIEYRIGRASNTSSGARSARPNPRICAEYQPAAAC